MISAEKRGILSPTTVRSPEPRQNGTGMANVASVITTAAGGLVIGSTYGGPIGAALGVVAGLALGVVASKKAN
jgi:hypothetical protein